MRAHRLPFDIRPLLIFAALFGVLIVLKGRFTGFDLRSLSVNALPLALLALGQFVIVLGRGIDLSLGPVASVASAVLALTAGSDPALGIALPLLVGLGAGLLNGVLIVGLGLPAIIVTLGTMSIWQGVALIVLPNPGGSVPSQFQDVLTGGFSDPLLGVIGLAGWALLVTYLLSTRFGLELRAIGSDEAAARLSGVPVARVRILSYAVGGVLAAIAGIYLGTAMSSGSPTVGDGYILTSIAAVVIGGVPLVGGRGAAFAVVVGALILTVTSSLLYFAGISSFYQSLIDGLILFAVVGSVGARDLLRDLVRR